MTEEKLANLSLYVGNLHPDCNDSILYKKFSLIGEVSSVKICRDSTTANSLGYGYVNFSDPEDAKKAIDLLNYDLMYGRSIRIMWAQKDPVKKLPQTANLVVKNLDPTIDELALKEMFSPFGEIMSIKVAKNWRGNSKGYGFVQFAEEEVADQAISALDGTEVEGKRVSVSRYISAEERRRYQLEQFPNNIYVSNLTTTTDDELFKICEAFGDVVSAKICSDEKSRSKGFGFVSFKEQEGAKKAIQELNRLCLNGKKLTACIANRKQNYKI